MSGAAYRVFCLLILLVGLSQAGCFEVRYVARQGIDLLQLMRSRREVAEVLTDPEIPHFIKQRLRLALQARQFGIDVLGLSGGADFTRYVDTHGHLGYNLTVAERTRLKLKTWGGGRLLYLGFLTRETALATQAQFERDGYDTYLRNIDAFSGLGVILSPIYSDMISGPGPSGELRTVETILHEMAHCSVPFFTQTELNEPFATTVGNYGAVLFFRQRERDSLVTVPSTAAKLSRRSAGLARGESALSVWLRGALIQLSAFYRKAEQDHLSPEEILRQRLQVFAELQASYRMSFPGSHYEPLSGGALNNAFLLSLGVYIAPGAEKEDKPKTAAPRASVSTMQKDLLASVGGDLRAYIALYRRAQAGNDALGWLRSIAEDYRKEVGLDK